MHMCKVMGAGLSIMGCCAVPVWCVDSAPEGKVPVTVEEIVVTASRRSLPLRDTADMVQVIDRAAIEEIKPSTTGELIEYATGVAASSGTGSGLPERSVISINGLPPNYTLVLVDGVRLLTDHMHSGQNVEFVPPDSIERIEIMRGAASAQYGTDAIGGIVNIITRKGATEPTGSVRVSASRYTTYESSLSLRTPVAPGLQLSSFADWKQSDGPPLKAPANRVGQTGFERFSLFNRVDAHAGPATDLFAAFNWVDFSMDWAGGRADSQLQSPVLGLRHAATPDVEVSGQVAFSQWEADMNEERNLLLEPEAQVTWTLAGGHTLMGGLDYKYNEFERTSVVAPDQQAYGAYVQDDWATQERIALMTALRFDEVEGIGSAVSPKASVLFLPVEPVRLRASVGRGFHAPTLQELYEEGYGHGGRAYRFGNPDLKPEYSTTYTFGMEVQPAECVTFLLNGYLTDLDDMIVPVYAGAWDRNPAIDVWRRTNIAKARVQGFEASARVRVTEQVRIEGGYTYTDNEDRETGRQLPYSPGASAFGRMLVSCPVTGRVDISGFVGVRTAYDREAWNWKPAAGAAPDNPNGLTTPLADYVKLDAGLSVVVDHSYEVFVKVENLLGEDIENLDDAYTVLDGKPVVQVGVKHDFGARQ